jgi:conjugal transfer pilus assembly protein TraV
MNYKILMISMTLSGLMTGCAPINTEFSCNATAGDRCLSIEEVYELSERSKSNIKPSQHHCTSCVASSSGTKQNKQAIWIPPRVDGHGVVYPANVVIADLNTQQIVA